VCKDIERTFGVLQCKFQIIAHPIEKWDKSRIKHTIHACIMLHNMMVQECNDNDENEESFQGMYDPGEDSNADNNDDNDVCNNTAGEEENSDTLSKNDNMIDQATEHVKWVEAEVRHRSMLIA